MEFTATFDDTNVHDVRITCTNDDLHDFTRYEQLLTEMQNSVNSTLTNFINSDTLDNKTRDHSHDIECELCKDSDEEDYEVTKKPKIN